MIYRLQLLDSEQKVAVLHSEVVAASEYAGDHRSAMAALQAELAPLVDDVTTLAQHLTVAAGVGAPVTAGAATVGRAAESEPSSLASDTAASPLSLDSTSVNRCFLF